MLRIGVLGAAKVAADHLLPYVRARGDVEVVAVAARDGDRARAFAREHGLAHGLDGYQALIDRADIDLVHIALPPAFHATWACVAVAAGKAVLCEKPFTMSASEASAMTGAAEAAGRPLLEAFHYVHHPLIQAARDIVRSGSLGTLLRTSASFSAPLPYDPDDFRWRASVGGGSLLDFGCYAVHVLRWLTGQEPRVLEASSVMRHGVDASTKAQLALPGSVEAEISCSMDGPDFEAPVRIDGTRGSLRLDNFVIPHWGGRLRWTIDGVSRELTAAPRATFDYQLEQLVAVMGGARPLTGGEDAVANMTILDAVRDATARPPRDRADRN